MVEGMMDDLTLLGIQTFLFDLSNDDSLETSLADITLVDHIDFIISINAVGLDLELGQELFLEQLGGQLFVFLVDHPVHLLHRIWRRNATILCVDESHVAFCQLCGFRAKFFPHALSSKQYGIAAFNSIERKSGVIAPMSHFDANHWKRELLPVWPQISEAHQGAANIWEFMRLIGVVPSGDTPARLEINQQVLSLLQCVDFLYRAEKRNEGLQKIAQLGIPVVLQGRNVDRFELQGENISLSNSISVSELINVIPSALYMFHSNPGFSAALHERLLLSIAGGTLIIVDDIKSIALVEPDFYVLGLSPLKSLTKTEYEERRFHNFFIAHEKHTWLQRFKSLLQREM